MTNFILNWVSGQGHIFTDGTFFMIFEKYKLDFEYDELYYEPESNLYFKMIKNVQYTLTEKEMDMCNDYCEKFINISDYPVQVYDKDTLLYYGTLLKSEAISKNLGYIVGDPPNHEVSKFINDAWERVVCVFLSDGSFQLYPTRICDSCVVFLTREEWEHWEKPTKSTEIWDFAKETWKDYRSLELAKHHAISWIRTHFDKQRIEVLGNVNVLETSSWSVQLEEASAYILDNTSATPFIDGALQGMEDIQTKEEFVNKILYHKSKEQLTKLGIIHGSMYKYIQDINKCNSLVEVDTLVEKLENDLKLHKLLQPVNIEV